jgi:hypothetical protein
MRRRLLRIVGFLGSNLLVAAVGPALSQTLYDTSPNSQTGTQVYGAYFSSDVDQVGLYNGNLSVRIPLFDLPGRELSAGRSLVYNAANWDQKDCGGFPCGQYTGGWRITGMFGSQPSFFAEYLSCSYDGGLWNPLYAMNVFWINSSGAKRRYLAKVFGSTTDPYWGECPSPQPPPGTT